MTQKRKGKKPFLKVCEKEERELAKEIELSESYVEEPVNRTAQIYEILREVETLVLTGHSAPEIKKHFLNKGENFSLDKVYRLRKIAMGKIKRRFEKDFQKDYIFARENFLRLFKEAFDRGDTKEQIYILEKYMKLSGLDVQKVEHTNFEVTPEMLENYEQMLLK